MQNPVLQYRSSLFATHDNIDESLAYFNSMLSTLSHEDRSGVNIALHCLLNTISNTIDDVYHPTKNNSIESLVQKCLDDKLACIVEEMINDRISDAIGQYMSDEFDINDYDDNIDWSYRIESNLDKEVLRDIVEETIKESITFEVRVS